MPLWIRSGKAPPGRCGTRDADTTRSFPHKPKQLAARGAGEDDRWQGARRRRTQLPEKGGVTLLLPVRGQIESDLFFLPREQAD